MKTIIIFMGVFWGFLLIPVSSTSQTNATDSVFYHWEKVIPSGDLPAARIWHSASDRTLYHQMIIFGGYSLYPFVPLNDLWSFNLITDQWQKLTPAGTLPPARGGHGAIMGDSVVSTLQFIVFGGQGSSSNCYNDTWAYDFKLNSWSQLSTTGTPPSPRYGFAYIYDPVSHRLVIFGGRNGNTLNNETWLLDIVTCRWTKLAVSFAPSPRYLCQAVYDSDHREMILFGGVDQTGMLKDVYRLQLSTLIWTQLSDFSYPVREQTTVYDPVTKLMINAGGTLSDSSTFGAFSNEISSWLRSAAEVNQPGQSYLSASVMDLTHHKMVMFGGTSVNHGAFSNDTYGLTWDVVPAERQVTGNINDAEIYCYDAWNTVNAGGNDQPFIVNPGGTAYLIAGQDILLKDNTIVHAGAFLHTGITTNSQYCDSIGLPARVEGFQRSQYQSDETKDHSSHGMTDTRNPFSVYPCPANDRVVIHSLTGEKPLNAVISDVVGRVKGSVAFNLQSGYEIPVSGFNDGLYLVTIFSESGRQTVKLVISRR